MQQMWTDLDALHRFTDLIPEDPMISESRTLETYCERTASQPFSCSTEPRHVAADAELQYERAASGFTGNLGTFAAYSTNVAGPRFAG